MTHTRKDFIARTAMGVISPEQERLYDAAPALLEACEYVVEQSALLRSDFSWIEKCRAAIAQAKGDQT